MERMTGVPFRCGCRPVWNRYGMNESLSLVNVRATSTAVCPGAFTTPFFSSSSSNNHGTRYTVDPCMRECDPSRPNATQRL